MSDANGVVLYTTEPCGFCRQAKALLQARGVIYREINLAKAAPSSSPSQVR